ncbi:ferredoxin [Nocardia sp. XZ_19_385]|uniref:ferredoxin n=1 Tax=Nocardia sp. XZ_19_385 TaxID=2769488 RepID=UPI00188F7BF5|nr:ferredoxin [Nocardia sp. XZ_19_385]
MTYVITESCVDILDRACVEECPVDCIYEGNRMMYIHPVECVECAACEVVCPVDAIYHEDDVPTPLVGYVRANAEVFSHLGSPGGAGTTGPIGRDADIVANRPEPGA